MIVFDGPVEPDDLTTFVREVPTPSENTLSAEFPVEYEDDNTVDFAEIVRTNRTARFRSFDGRIHVSRRDSSSESRVKLLPLSSSLAMGEYERLQLEFARLGGTNSNRLATAVYNDSEQLTREVQNRLEQAWGDVLSDGKLTIAENGFAGEADFGVPADQIVAPSTAWTDIDNSTILTDLQTWSDVWLGNNGSKPARAKTSQRMLRLALRNKEVIDAVYGATQGRTRVKLSELNDLLFEEDLPTFDKPYDTQFDVDGVTTRSVADNKVMLLPQDLATLGATKIGVTATALELVNSSKSDMDFEEAPGIVGVIEKDGPPYRQFAYVDCVGMPVLKQGKRLLVATVG